MYVDDKTAWDNAVYAWRQYLQAKEQHGRDTPEAYECYHIYESAVDSLKPGYATPYEVSCGAD